MATWNQVRELIQTTFPTNRDFGDCLKINFKLDEERSQLLFIERRVSQGAGDWIQVSSPIGIIPPEKMDELLEEVYNVVFGGVVKIEGKHYLRESMPLEDISSERLMSVMASVNIFADDLEKKYVGGDEN